MRARHRRVWWARRAAYIGRVRFDGQVWFDFSHRDVWEFYSFARALAGAGATVALEWKPFVPPDQVGLASTFLELGRPGDRGVFLHAALGLVHLEGADPSDDATVRRALSVARLDQTPSMDTDAVDRVRAMGQELGVVRVPSLYRHGPVAAVSLTAAALHGDVIGRARTILDILEDDGVWVVAKP